ncbi:ferredoxin [Streptomyces griseoviridis]|uniref:ferredoxin n=1 Tax=Streptomyces griseoviridis TaxID=45398 RepID=UPI00344E65BF
MTSSTSQQELFRYLEDRFGCAQACSDCARACAVRAGLLGPEGNGEQERVRRKGVMCAEVCDATCVVLSEQNSLDEAGTRVQLEWCRSVCLETAEILDGQPGATKAAQACRACAQACADFSALLTVM